MRQTIAGLALLMGLSGCRATYETEATNKSKGSITTVAIPEGCTELIDVRYIPNYRYSSLDEVICSDKDGNRIIYIKHANSEVWSVRRYETGKTKNVIESPE